MPPTRSTHCRRSRATPLRRTPVCTPISNRARIAGWKSPASIPARQRGGRSVGPTCAANACGRRPRRRPATAAAACAGHSGHAGAGRRARNLVRIRLTIAPPSVTATPLNPSPGLSRRRYRADPSDNRRSSTAASVANASRCRQRDGKWRPRRPRRLTRRPPSTSTRPSLHSGGSDASNANPEPDAGHSAHSSAQLRGNLRNGACHSSRWFEDFKMTVFLGLGAMQLSACRDQFRQRPTRIAPPSLTARKRRERLRDAGEGQAVETSTCGLLRPDGPQTLLLPPGSGSAAGFPAASPIRVSARIHSKNARASGLSRDPGATAMK